MTVLALAAAQAGAQERSPYYIGLSQQFTHDNNVYRTATNPVAETISTTGVVAGIDQPIGRQRLYGDASAQVNRFRHLDELNNKSYSLLAGLDWETVDFLTGTLRYSTRNSLADFGTLEGSTAPSDQITQQFLANARYGIELASCRSTRATSTATSSTEATSTPAANDRKTRSTAGCAGARRAS